MKLCDRIVMIFFPDCPPCYDLVLEKVNIHREKLKDLRVIIENVASNPGSFNDTDFLKRMSEVNDSVNVLLNDARNAVGKPFKYRTLFLLLKYNPLQYISWKFCSKAHLAQVHRQTSWHSRPFRYYPCNMLKQRKVKVRVGLYVCVLSNEQWTMNVLTLFFDSAILI